MAHEGDYQRMSNQYQTGQTQTHSGCNARSAVGFGLISILLVAIATVGASMFCSTGLRKVPAVHPSLRSTSAKHTMPSTFLQCPTCAKDPVSLDCGACQTRVSPREFCRLCKQAGLNHVGCGRCVNDSHDSDNRFFGNDADEHGCRASAGYMWCEAASSCVRSWEIQHEFLSKCQGLGHDKDEHGCIPSAGYHWCHATSECIRPWEKSADFVATCNRNNYSGHVHQVFGGDRDEHGCIHSAGYRWCPATSECIRPWEKSADFVAKCNSSNDSGHVDPVFMGGDRDEHGCIQSAGYVWCAAKSECVRPWERSADFVAKCERKNYSGHVHQVFGGDRDEHGCIHSAGYRWCPATSECIRPWEKSADFVAKCNSSNDSGHVDPVFMGGDRDEHGCIHSAGYVWCAATSECVRPWEKSADFVAKCIGSNYSGRAYQNFMGGDRDEHGCIHSAGYGWCAATSECIRPWEKSADFVAKCNGTTEKYGVLGSQLRMSLEHGDMMEKSKMRQTCNCPPSYAIWPCTTEEYKAIKNGSTCPFYRSAPSKEDHSCNCPPAEAEWFCSEDDYIAIRNGSKCPFYKPTVQESRKDHMCSCPPAESEWLCTMDEYRAIKNGSTCPFYSLAVQASRKDRNCNCPPAEAEWLCTMDEYTAIRNGSTCPFYMPEVQASRKDHMCNCPPAEAEWSCGMDEYTAIKNGSTCPFYKPKVQDSKKDHMCSCPPAQVEWLCTMDEYASIKNGSKCPFYKPTVQESRKDHMCSCPPAEAEWLCTMDEYTSIRNGSTCPFYSLAVQASKKNHT